jgi:hypothetical protein
MQRFEFAVSQSIVLSEEGLYLIEQVGTQITKRARRRMVLGVGSNGNQAIVADGFSALFLLFSFDRGQ